MKKNPVGFRLLPETKQDIVALADIWSVSQQQVFERAINEFLAQKPKAIQAGRKLRKERVKQLEELQELTRWKK